MRKCRYVIEEERMNRKIGLALILIMAIFSISVFAVKPTLAQSTPWVDNTFPPSSIAPAVPTFTVEPVGPPTVVNTTYALNQATGKIVANVGYTNEYSALNITIRNQVYSNLDGNMAYFNVRVKNNPSSNWTTIYDPDNGFPTQSTSEYTTISLSIGANAQIPVGAETDIQVQALVGNLYVKVEGWSGELWAFNGTESDWSNTQTVTLPANASLIASSAESSVATTPTSTAASMAPPGSFVVIEILSLTVIAVLLSVIVILLLHRTQHPQ